MLILRRLVLKNFGPHEDFELMFSDGVIGFIGKCGSGKTHLIDYALFFSMTGTLPDVKKSYITWGKDEGSTTLEFQSVELERLYQLIRYLNSDKVILISNKFNEKTQMWACDNKIIGSSKVKEFMENSLLTVQLDQIKSAALCSQGSIISVAEFTPTDMTNYLQRITGLYRFERLRGEIQARINAIAIPLCKKTEISVLKTDIEARKGELAAYIKEGAALEEWLKNNRTPRDDAVTILKKKKKADRDRELNTLSDNLAAIDKSIAEKKAEKGKALTPVTVTKEERDLVLFYKRDYLAAKAKKEEAESGLAKLRLIPDPAPLPDLPANLDELILIANQRETTVKNVEAKTKVRDGVNEKVAALAVVVEPSVKEYKECQDFVDNEADSYTHALTGKCPTCGGEFKPELHSSEAKDKIIADFIAEYETARSNLPTLQTNYNLLKAEYDTYVKAKERLDKELLTANTNLSAEENILKQQDEKLGKYTKASLAAISSALTTYNKAKEDFNSAQKTIKDKENESVEAQRTLTTYSYSEAEFKAFCEKVDNADAYSTWVSSTTGIDESIQDLGVTRALTVSAIEKLAKEDVLTSQEEVDTNNFINEFKRKGSLAREKSEAINNTKGLIEGKEEQLAAYEKDEVLRISLENKKAVLQDAVTALKSENIPAIKMRRNIIRLNQQLDLNLSEMQVDFTAEIDLDFNFNVTFNNGKRTIAARLSGGQKAMLGLAFHLAKRDMLKEVLPLMVLDEPTAYLDKVYLNNVANLLKAVSISAQDSFAILIVTHEQELISSMTRTVNLDEH